MSEQQVTLLKSLYDAFGRGDIPTVLGAMDASIEWVNPQAPGYPFGGLHRGPQGVATGVFGQIPAHFAEYLVTPKDFVDAGDRILVLGDYRGKGKAHGTAFQADFIHVFTFRGDQWVGFQEYTNTGAIAAALT
jgi:uncharacterized protein